jgi:hypothetical protein
MSKQRFVFCAVISVLSAFFSVAHAEVITINQQAPGFDRQQLPPHGMSMSKVSAHYGKPVEEAPAVGNPPITKWIYDQYTVYFEHQHVIHAVVHADADATKAAGQ